MQTWPHTEKNFTRKESAVVDTYVALYLQRLPNASYEEARAATVVALAQVAQTWRERAATADKSANLYRTEAAHCDADGAFARKQEEIAADARANAEMFSELSERCKTSLPQIRAMRATYRLVVAREPKEIVSEELGGSKITVADNRDIDDEKVREASQDVIEGLITVNEAREKLGLPLVPEGDVSYIRIADLDQSLSLEAA